MGRQKQQQRRPCQPPREVNKPKVELASTTDIGFNMISERKCKQQRQAIHAEQNEAMSQERCKVSLTTVVSSTTINSLDLTEEQWHAVREKMPGNMTRAELNDVLGTITGWVKEAVSKVLLPAMGMALASLFSPGSTSGISLPSSSPSGEPRKAGSGSVSSSARLGVAHSAHRGGSATTIRRSSCSPPHRYVESDLPLSYASTCRFKNQEVDEALDKLPCGEESGNDGSAGPVTEPLKALFGITKHGIFNNVQTVIYRSVSDVGLATAPRACPCARAGSVSAFSLTSEILDGVMKQVNSGLSEVLLRAAFNRASPAGRCSSVLLADRMLRVVTAKLHAVHSEQAAVDWSSASRGSPTDTQQELEVKLAPVAVQVTDAILGSMMSICSQGMSADVAGCGSRADAPLCGFLQAMADNIKDLSLDRSVKAEPALSARRAGSGPLLSVSMQEKRRTPARSASDALATDCVVKNKHLGYCLSNGRLATQVTDAVDNMVDLLSGSGVSGRSSRQSQSSWSGSDQSVIGMKEEETLSPRCEEIRPAMSGVKTFLQDPTQHRTPSPLPLRDPSVASMVSLCEYSSDSSRESQGSLKGLVARELVRSVVGDIVQNAHPILDQSVVTQDPELSTSLIYRSLLLGQYARMGPHSERVVERIVFGRDEDRAGQWEHSSEVHMQWVLKLSCEDFHVEATQVVSQIIGETSAELVAETNNRTASQQASRLDVELSVPPEPKQPSLTVEAASDVVDAVLKGLKNYLQGNKDLANPGTDPVLFSEQVQLVSEGILVTVQTKLKDIFMEKHPWKARESCLLESSAELRYNVLSSAKDVINNVLINIKRGLPVSGVRESKESLARLFITSVEDGLEVLFRRNIDELFGSPDRCDVPPSSASSSERTSATSSLLEPQQQPDPAISRPSVSQMEPLASDGMPITGDILNIIAERVMKTIDLQQTEASTSVPKKLEKLLSRENLRQCSAKLIPQVRDLIVESGSTAEVLRLMASRNASVASPGKPSLVAEEVHAHYVFVFVNNTVRKLLQQCLGLSASLAARETHQAASSSFSQDSPASGPRGVISELQSAKSIVTLKAPSQDDSQPLDLLNNELVKHVMESLAHSTPSSSKWVGSSPISLTRRHNEEVERAEKVNASSLDKAPCEGGSQKGHGTPPSPPHVSILTVRSEVEAGSDPSVSLTDVAESRCRRRFSFLPRMPKLGFKPKAFKNQVDPLVIPSQGQTNNQQKSTPNCFQCVSASSPCPSPELKGNSHNSPAPEKSPCPSPDTAPKKRKSFLSRMAKAITRVMGRKTNKTIFPL